MSQNLKMMRVVLVCVWASTAAGQSLLSSLLSPGSRPSLTASSPVLLPPPLAPSHRLVLSPRSPHGLGSVGLTAASPQPQPVFSASPQLEEVPTHSQTTAESVKIPQFAIAEDRSTEEPDAELQQALTSSPAIAPPTTIKFTLDDVPKFWQPQLFPPQLDVKALDESYEDDALSLLRDSVKEEDLIFSPSVTYEQTPKYLFILTSTEGKQSILASTEREQELSTTPQTSKSSAVTGRSLEDPSLPVLHDVDESFRPSLTFPFLEDSTEEPHNSVTLTEARRPVVDSFLHSQPLHYIESESNVFTIKPVRIDVEDSVDNIAIEDSLDSRHLSKTPVPKVVNFSEEKESAEKVTKTDKPIPTRKTFHFDQEFLALLKNYNPTEKNKASKTESSSEANPFWFSDQTEGAWRLKGGARSPAINLSREEVPPHNPVQALGGVFATSLRGLTTTTVKSTRSTEGPASGAEGPRIVSVGEVGEVPHHTQEAVTSSATPLSAALKHGVQSLNVSAWVSGCPKLYGKVELKCEVHHDSLANTATTLMWKKKSFSEGRPEEKVVAEGDILKLEDSRFSLQRAHSHYDLVIKDFRPKDCGTYECEARAADTVAASQLLLFTCL